MTQDHVSRKRDIRKSVAEAQGISRKARDVLRALAQRINDMGQCWPSQRTIAEDANLSPRTVWAALDELEQGGWISRDRRHKRCGYRSSDLITVRTLEQAAAWVARKLESLVDMAKRALDLRLGQLAKFANKPSDSFPNPDGREGLKVVGASRRPPLESGGGSIPRETRAEMAARWRAMAPA